MEIKVKKNLRLKANVAGLEIQSFYILLFVVSMLAFYIITGEFFFSKLIYIGVIGVGTYFVLLAFQNTDIGSLIKKLPNKILK